MDLCNKNEYEFLDLTGLDENIRDELRTILRSNMTTEILKLPWDTGETSTYDLHATGTQIFDEQQNHWHQCEMQGEVTKCDRRNDVASSSVLVTAMLHTHCYTPQIMTTMYNEWPSNAHVNNATMVNANIPPFMSGIPYSSPTYVQHGGGEIHDTPTGGRGGGRRNNRGRGIKRDTYNRGIVPMNEMQTGYVREQGQYISQIPPIYPPFYCQSPDHSASPQQHPAAGQPLYLTQSRTMCSPMPHPHSYAHTQYNYSLPPQRSQYNVQPGLTPYANHQESAKNFNVKSHDKRANSYRIEPPYHQVVDEDHNSSQTNIVTTVIVESDVNNVNKNSTVTKKSSTNTIVSPVNVKIKHNIVSTTLEENCAGTEKNGKVPRVNVNSSIEVEQNRESDNKARENDIVSHIEATVVNKTASEAPADASDSETLPKEEAAIVAPAGKTPESFNDNTASPLPATSQSPPTSASRKSWASLLKGYSEPHSTFASGKPTARINPLNVNANAELSSLLTTQQAIGHSENSSSSALKNDATEPVANNQINNHKSARTGALENHFDPLAYRIGEFLMQYQMDRQTVSLLPRGLTNRSNYCYINSILQALLACPPFYNLLMAIPSNKSSSKNSSTPLIDNMVKFVREFSPLSEGARSVRKDRTQKRSEDAVVDIQSGVAFEPSYVYTMLQNTSSAGVFSVEGRQEDAEEFLSCLLNGISDEMLELMKLVSNDQKSTTENIDPGMNHNNQQGDFEEWKVMGPKNKGSITRCTEFGRTPVSDIFRGQLRSRVQRTGDLPTDNVQPFFTLQLDIEKAESVNGALEILVGKDQVEGMTCSKTKQEIEAWKQVTLEELPVILILHLKWFDYKLDGCSKIVKSVEFPVDLKIDNKLLSMNNSKKFNKSQRQYKLFAVTYHDGKEATKGHYVTDAFHVGYGGWVRYDDSSLKGVSESNVLNPTPPRVPYLLYYRRCDTIKPQNIQPHSGKIR